MKNPRTFMVSIFAILLAFAFSAGCGGGGGGSSTPPNTIVPPGNNVAPISVNGGPLGDYADAAFISVTVCVPGTSTCQTVDNILVDTGSSGLRVLSSALTVALPQQNAAGGNPVFECFPFDSGYTWGPVQTADVKIAGETASSTPIEAVGTNVTVPDGCLSFDLPPSNNIDELGANGILGVGLFAPDCGSGCPTEIYYECPASGCFGISPSVALQVTNPVSLFTTDNNGVIVELPAVSGGQQPTLSGSLVFGIGTETNNALGAAKVYGADPEFGEFTTSFNGTAYSGSFIDSGSNGYFFLSSSVSGIAACGGDDAGFYCPSSTANLSATNEGTNGTSGTVDFSIADASTLFSSGDNAFADLGGEISDSPPYFFDWGLPFFFGRNVYVAIQGQNAPGGTAPYWAY
jgi:Protein of unknown function (DUF3443)